MPPLPRKNNRREAHLDGKVAQWLRKNHPCRNWLLEVKMKGGKFLEHQKIALRQVEAGKFLYKIPDSGSRNPADYVCLGDADAIYCVIDGKNVHCEVNGGVIKYNFTI